MATEPMIKLEPGGKAPVLSYNVPEPTSYSGRNLIELDVPEDWFKPVLKQRPAEAVRTPIKAVSAAGGVLPDAVADAMKGGFADTRIFPNVKLLSGTLRFVSSPNPGLRMEGTLPVTEKLARLDPVEVAAMLEAGKRLNIYRSLSGAMTYNYIPEPKAVRPRLLLVETYRLSSFLGTYGAGRTIKTFTLLPGERTKVSVKTYTRRATDAKQASSILDSFTEESAQEFETSLQSEQSNKAAYSESFEYHAEAEAEASWGWGNAKVSGGVKGGSQSSREEFAKNASSATQKHAAKASAKRDVQINTSYEVKEETGEETAIEREIQNINLSRTLNFIFRQMNQEFISILHLVDVRVAFFNGFAESKREVALPELDSLLEGVLVDDAGKRDQVKAWILDELEAVFDFEGNLQSFVEERKRKDAAGNALTPYHRARTEITSKYTDPVTGTEREVDGVILDVRKSVLRTEGVIVEALLGQGEALDEYATKLQELEVERREGEVALARAELDRVRLVNRVTRDTDEERAKILKDLTESLTPGSAPLTIRLLTDKSEPPP